MKALREIESRKSRTRDAAFLELLSALCFGACGERHSGLLGHLIEQDATSVLDPRELVNPETVFKWSFRTPKDLEGWKCVQLDLVCRVERERLLLRSTKDRPRLTREISFPASSVHSVQVTTVGPAENIHLAWAGSGKGFSPKRRILLRFIGKTRDRRRIYEAYLAGHPRWRGEIRRLRLDPADRPGSQTAIAEISLIRYRPTSERLDVAADSPFSIQPQAPNPNAQTGSFLGGRVTAKG